ncbi:MAG: reverse transcriptase/maturase family protein [Defluviitaleaceae bacterium]|nr:reverse transcriptase/maturase family protein [Defluviitaleaceae bacterium]
MKRIKNLFPKIYDFERLLFAYNQAKESKRYKHEVLKFSANLEENLIDLQNHLIYKSYEVGRYHEFYVHDPKTRLIMALPFRDRVVQWAAYSVLNPIFAKGYIADSHGCILKRGTLSAIARLRYWLRMVNKAPMKYYYLKLDISKYFYRIDHEILLEIIGRKIADPDVMWLMEKIIKSEDTAFGLPHGYAAHETDERLFDKGMPIGNLTSQMFANIYLNELDQYVKRELGVRHYIRYMDDIVILSYDKEELHRLKNKIAEFLEKKLHLSLNEKTCVRPITLGIDFLGYKVWPTHIKLRKSSALKMKKRLAYIQKQYARGEIDFKKADSTVQSYLGILSHCNSLRLKQRIFGDFVLRRDDNEDKN